MKFAKCTDLRRNLAELLDHVKRGGNVVLLRRGQPVARLVPMDDEADLAPRWKRRVASRPLQGASIVETLRAERDAR